MRSPVAIIVSFMLLVPLVAHGQRDASVWYFGFGAGIDFRGGTPVALSDGAIRQPEGCASIADPETGQLLFYTDGITVWNRLHQPMPNGRGLRGHESSTQSALIVPAPCDAKRFYIFTADVADGIDPPNDGIHYSIVDMSAAGGLGDVSVRNVPVNAPSAEKLVGVRHGNGVDFWVIFHQWESNLYFAYLLTESGLASEPVRSYIGTVHEGIPRYAAGYLKVSPDGRWLASSIVDGMVELFTFDDRTGLIDDNLTLSSNGNYGLSFSHDSRILYMMEDTVLYQYNVAAGSRWGILNSRTRVGTGLLYAMQLAPDGRIYIANNSDYVPEELGWLATIDQPNVQGTGCGFNRRGFRLDDNGATPHVGQGLPNMIDSFMGGIVRPCGPPVPRFEVDEPLCAGECADFKDASRNLPIEWNWSFPGASPSSSTEQNPTGICYPEPGDYDVILRTRNRFGEDSIRRKVVVVAPADVHARIVDATASPGDTVGIGVFIGAAPNGPVDSVRVVVGYDPAMMAPLGVSADGFLLEDWVITDTADAAAKTVIVTARAPSGVQLNSAGRLFDIVFATWLTTATSTPLSISVVMPELACGNVVGTPGRLDLDICGLELRQIEPVIPLALSTLGPNPLDVSTTIRFSLPDEGRVRVTIHDAVGAELAVLVDAEMAAGDHQVDWRPGSSPAGIYRCQLVWNRSTVSTALVVVR